MGNNSAVGVYKSRTLRATTADLGFVDGRNMHMRECRAYLGTKGAPKS